VTPALSAVYEELLQRASSAPWRERAEALKEDFLRRTSSTGGKSGLSEPPRAAENRESEERLRAAWDDVLTRGGLAGEIADELDDPSERALARVLSRAHRGLFRLTVQNGHGIVADVVSGASFLLIRRDDIGRAVAATSDETALFEARVVAATDGCAMLPGVIFHPPDATPHIHRIVAAARSRGMPEEELCDALLRMHHAFSTLSRVKIAYAYKLEALAPRGGTDAGATPE
jgi:hypothetical protein